MDLFLRARNARYLKIDLQKLGEYSSKVYNAKVKKMLPQIYYGK